MALMLRCPGEWTEGGWHQELAFWTKALVKLLGWAVCWLYSSFDYDCRKLWSPPKGSDACSLSWSVIFNPGVQEVWWPYQRMGRPSVKKPRSGVTALDPVCPPPLLRRTERSWWLPTLPSQRHCFLLWIHIQLIFQKLWWLDIRIFGCICLSQQKYPLCVMYWASSERSREEQHPYHKELAAQRGSQMCRKVSYHPLCST